MVWGGRRGDSTINLCKQATDGVPYAPAERLEQDPQKTKLVYCKDANRSGDHPIQSFEFLGYGGRFRRFRLKRVADIIGEQTRALRVRSFVNFLQREPA